MNILGGHPIDEGGVGGRNGLLGPGGHSELILIVGGILDSVLETVLEEEFKEDAVQLHRNGRHLPSRKTEKDKPQGLELYGFKTISWLHHVID